MENLNNFILEKLKINSKSKINSEISKISTFEELKEKYGAKNKNPEKLNKTSDWIIIDNNYYDNIYKVYHLSVIKWGNYYSKFTKNEKVYNNYTDEYFVSIAQSQDRIIKISCRDSENNDIRTFIEITEDNNGCFELYYQLNNNYKNTESILVKAFEYMMTIEI